MTTDPKDDDDATEQLMNELTLSNKELQQLQEELLSMPRETDEEKERHKEAKVKVAALDEEIAVKRQKYAELVGENDQKDGEGDEILEEQVPSCVFTCVKCKNFFITHT